MIFLEIFCFEFPCVAGAHFPKIGGWFSQSRRLIFPKSTADFPKVGGWFSQSRSLIFPKSVADFPKVDGWFSQSRWLIFSKSVADFPKVGRWFSQSRRLIFPKSVADFPKVGGWFSQSRWLIFPQPNLFCKNRTEFSPKPESVFFCSNKASLSLKRSLCCCFNLGSSHTVQKDENTRKKNCIPQFFSRFSFDFPSKTLFPLVI